MIGIRLKNEKYDRVYTSDLQRCTDTLDIIRAYSNHKYMQWYQQIVYEKRLREMALGRVEGLKKT